MSPESLNGIHPTAIVHPGASLGEGTTVGAYSIVDAEVRTGRNCVIQEHVVIRGHTTLGDEVKVFPFAAIGGEPQHLKYRGEPTTVSIGDRVTLREYATVHRGTVMGNRTTTVGNDSYIMAYVHIAHDCVIGNNVILANNIQFAGHVIVEDFVTIGGQSAVAQFCRVGRYCYIGGGTIIRKDVAPYLVGKGCDFEVQGINVVGLTRAGFSEPTVRRLKTLYKTFFMQRLTVAQATERVINELGETGEIKLFLDFVKDSKLGFHR